MFLVPVSEVTFGLKKGRVAQSTAFVFCFFFSSPPSALGMDWGCAAKNSVAVGLFSDQTSIWLSSEIERRRACKNKGETDGKKEVSIFWETLFFSLLEFVCDVKQAREAFKIALSFVEELSCPQKTQYKFCFECEKYVMTLQRLNHKPKDCCTHSDNSNISAIERFTPPVVFFFQRTATQH